MSIISIRKAMETKGCQAVLVVIGVAIAAGMVLSGNPFANQQQQQGADPVVFSVGEKKIGLNRFNDRVKLVSQNQQFGAGTAFAELTNTVTAIQAFVEDAANASLAKEKGVAVTETNAKQVAETVAKQSIEQYRAQLIVGGQIKPDATEEEATKKLTELTGKTPEQLTTEQVDQIMKNYNDPKTKADVVAGLTSALLQEHYSKNTTYTEEDLKKSYEEYTFQIIRFDNLSKGLSEREDEAIAALDKIKGGTDFGAVQKEYDSDAKPEDRKVSLTVGLLETSTDLKALKELKPGEVSEIITSNGSPTIYKLESVKPNLPPDFEKSKAMLLENNRASRSRQAYQEEQKKKIEQFKPKFEDKGLGIAYEVFQEFNKPEVAGNPEKLKEFLLAKKAEVRDPEFTSQYFQNLVAATEFLIVESLYSQATAEEKKEMIDERIESARNMLTSFEDNAFRLQFASELLNSERPEEAFQFALNAAENNGDFEMTGQAVTDQITALVVQAVKDKKWNADQEKTIRAELDRWQNDRNLYVKEQQEIEEANKKAQEELDKEKVESGEPKPAETTENTGN